MIASGQAWASGVRFWESPATEPVQYAYSPSVLKLRFLRPQPVVCSGMHAFGARWEGVINAALRSQTFTDLEGFRSRPRKVGLVLSVIFQSLAKAAAEQSTAVEYPAPPFAGETLEPLTRASEAKRRFDEWHNFVDTGPFIIGFSVAVLQSETPLQALDAD